jgi:hypothetical protein
MHYDLYDTLWKQFKRWHNSGRAAEMQPYQLGMGDKHLTWLVKKADWEDVYGNHEDLMRLLIGPNGWTIYKILRIRRDE